MTDNINRAGGYLSYEPTPEAAERDLAEYIEDARADDQLGWDNDSDLRRYFLVERSRFDQSLFVTTHESLEDASRYRDNQECPEDWIVETLIDRQTGERFSPLVTTAWLPAL